MAWRLIHMYRAGFLAFGLYLVLLGGGLFFVDELTLNQKISSRAAPLLNVLAQPDSSGRHHLHPPEWAPFSLLGLGVITMLYAIALPKQ